MRFKGKYCKGKYSKVIASTLDSLFLWEHIEYHNNSFKVLKYESSVLIQPFDNFYFIVKILETKITILTQHLALMLCTYYLEWKWNSVWSLYPLISITIRKYVFLASKPLVLTFESLLNGRRTNAPIFDTHIKNDCSFCKEFKTHFWDFLIKWFDFQTFPKSFLVPIWRLKLHVWCKLGQVRLSCLDARVC